MQASLNLVFMIPPPGTLKGLKGEKHYHTNLRDKNYQTKGARLSFAVLNCFGFPLHTMQV